MATHAEVGTQLVADGIPQGGEHALAGLQPEAGHPAPTLQRVKHHGRRAPHRRQHRRQVVREGKKRTMLNMPCHGSQRINGFKAKANRDPLIGHPWRVPLLTFTSATGLPAASNTVVLSPYMLSINITKRSETPMRLSTMNIQIRTKPWNACAKSRRMPTAPFPLLKLAVVHAPSNPTMHSSMRLALTKPLCGAATMHDTTTLKRWFARSATTSHPVCMRARSA